jgi:hypothetical protein
MAIDWGAIQQDLNNIGNQTSQLWTTNQNLIGLSNTLKGFNVNGLSSSLSTLSNASNSLVNEFGGIGTGLSNLGNSITGIGSSIGGVGTNIETGLLGVGQVINQDVAGIQQTMGGLGQIFNNAEGTFTNLSNSFGNVSAEVAGLGNLANTVSNWDWKTIAIRGGLIIVGVIVLIVGITKL